jgi:hypothetical protein
MDLRNFRLEKPAYAIALEGLGFYWDLHAFAELTTVKYLPADKSAELK